MEGTGTEIFGGHIAGHMRTSHHLSTHESRIPDVNIAELQVETAPYPGPDLGTGS